MWTETTNALNDDSVIYVDHSILSTVGACKEKGRLAYVEHLRPSKEPPLQRQGVSPVECLWREQVGRAARRKFQRLRCPARLLLQRRALRECPLLTRSVLGAADGPG